MSLRSFHATLRFLLLLLVVTASGVALADAPPVEHSLGSPIEGAEAHGQIDPAVSGHGATQEEGDHWSLVSQLAPGLVHNLQGALGNSYIGGTPVLRVVHVFMAFVVMLLLVALALSTRKKLANPEDMVVPETKLTGVTFFEMIVGGILTMLQTSMGLSEKKAKQVLPLVASLAAFILFSNVIGMVPGFLPPTDNLNTTLALGLVVFGVTHVIGIRNSGIAYFKHFFGPIIAWYALPLMLLMFVIEMISHVARPISLALRLMGNMFGDHKVLGIFLGFGIVLVPLPIMVLGLLVAVVQTLVFCLLTMVYFSIALEDAGHH